MLWEPASHSCPPLLPVRVRVQSALLRRDSAIEDACFLEALHMAPPAPQSALATVQETRQAAPMSPGQPCPGKLEGPHGPIGMSRKLHRRIPPALSRPSSSPGPATSGPVRPTGGKPRANPPGADLSGCFPISWGLISSAFGERRHWKGQPAATPWLRVQTLGIFQPNPAQ